MRHTRYVVEMEKYDEGYDPNVQEYDPNKITSLDYKAEEGFDEQEAHDAALAAHPDYVIIGHHIEWWDDDQPAKPEFTFREVQKMTPEEIAQYAKDHPEEAKRIRELIERNLNPDWNKNEPND